MIPKIIHYCWFGGKKKPKTVKKCIKSWKKYCPDFEIVEWNEKNSKYTDCLYSKQAYDCKKWAFVSDYVRLCSLFEYGGIYLDTDYELIKPIDDLLLLKCFVGFETPNQVAAGIIGAEPKNPFIKEWLSSYSNRSFLGVDGTMDVTTIVHNLTHLLKNEGLELNNETQTISNITVYSTQYFYPYDYVSKNTTITDLTYGIHWYDASWLTSKQKFIKFLGPRATSFAVKLKHCFKKEKKK